MNFQIDATAALSTKPKEPPAPAAAVSPPDHSPDHARRRVLVVDDAVAVAHAVQRMLAPDHDVDVATGGSGALDLIERHRYDAVVCDLIMPDLTGMALHAAVAERYPQLLPRIIFMTGGTFIAGSAEFLERIPNPRLFKPFEASELRDTVRKLLRG